MKQIAITIGGIALGGILGFLLILSGYACSVFFDRWWVGPLVSGMIAIIIIVWVESAEKSTK